MRIASETVALSELESIVRECLHTASAIPACRSTPLGQVDDRIWTGVRPNSPSPGHHLFTNQSPDDRVIRAHGRSWCDAKLKARERLGKQASDPDTRRGLLRSYNEPCRFQSRS